MEVEPTDAELVQMADALDPPPHGKAHEDRMEQDAAMDPPTRQDAAALHVGTREEYPTRPMGAAADPERVRATIAAAKMQDPGVDAVRFAKRSRMVAGTGPTTSVGVETAAPAAGAGTSLSETDEHDAAVAVSKYGPFPRLVTDEFELLKYLPGLNGLAGAAVLKQRYSILVVRPRTSMPDDAQFHTIEHAVASADRESILVIIDNGWHAATGAHRMPYTKGWFIAEPEFATVREYDPVGGIVTAVYEENALLRDPINRKAPFPAPPREISVLVDQLHADNARRKVLAEKSKLTAAEKRELAELKANVSGTFFSPYVSRVPRSEPFCVGVIKTAAYDIDSGRHIRYNAKPNAAAALKFGGRVVLPMLDQLLTEATGSPWTYAKGEERTTAVRAYQAMTAASEEDACDSPPPVVDRARRWSTVLDDSDDDDEEPTCSMPFLVGDILTIPPEWLVRTTKTREGSTQVRFAIPIGGGRCAIPESVVLEDLRYLMQHYITTVALVYGGMPSETIPHPRYANMGAFRPTAEILQRINREIRSGAITRRAIDDPYRRMARILIASSTRQQQRQLNTMYATTGPSTATLATAPPCIRYVVDSKMAPPRPLKNGIRHAWCAAIGVSGADDSTIGDIEDMLKGTINAGRIPAVQNQLKTERRNPRPFPCCKRRGAQYADTEWTCMYQGGGGNLGDNVRACMAHRTPREGVTIDPMSVSPGEIWRDTIPK